MKKIYIVYCWSGKKDDGWYPWLDKELSSNKVYRFDMPNSDTPKIEDWVSFLDKQVDCLDENTYFVGHSIGCQTIMRYLQTKDVCKIGGLLFVTPWFDLLDYAIEDEDSYEIAKPWLTEKIDFEKIKKFTNNIHCIFSDDDYFVPLWQKEKFEKLLGAQTIVVNGKGHISKDDNVFELKEILDECNKMISLDEKVLKAREFCRKVKDLAREYDLSFFVVTEGASAISNNGCDAVKNARDSHIKWELEHNSDPYEDWS